MTSAETRPSPLSGRTVAITADRRGEELQASLQRLGARVVWGSTMRAVSPEVDERLVEETTDMLAAAPTWFAVSTGSGLRAWLAAAARTDQAEPVLTMLRAARIVARGSKSHGALRALGIEPVFVSAQETMDDVCSWLGDRMHPGDVLGAQVHGGEVIGTLDALRARFGDVHTVAPYRWALPDDLTAARQVVAALVAGEIDVLAQTSAPSARNLFVVADDLGLRRPLLDRLRGGEVCVAAVGPVTARAFEEVGVGVHVMPPRGRTADLLRAIVHWATVIAPDRPAPGGPPDDDAVIALVPDASAVRLGPSVVRLGRQEFAVLAAMMRRPGVVLKPDELALQAWGHRAPDDATQVRHQVARIRRKLGVHGATVQTVRNVGYRYQPPSPPLV